MFCPDTVHIFTTCLHKIHFNITYHFRLCFQNHLFWTDILCKISVLPIRAQCTVQYSIVQYTWFRHLKNIRQRMPNVRIIIMWLSLFCHLSLLRQSRQFSSRVGPNVEVNHLTLLLHIRQVPGSNLGPETDCPDWGVSWLSSVPSGICQDCILN
jgi:hypothetical protein